MKLRYYLIPFAAALTACGGNNADKESDSTILNASDSVSADIPTELAETIDTIPAYYSDDLKKFGLHGRVKSVKTKDYPSFVTCLSGPLAFDEVGKLTSSFSEFTDNKISCNDNGFIDETDCRESDGTTFELEFTSFDSNGNPVKGEYKTEGPDGLWEVDFTITYLDFDRENNWTKRSFEGKSSTSVLKETGDYSREQTEPFSATESRTIVYWRN